MRSTLAFLVLAFLAGTAAASNYPPDYCHQTVRVLHDGPALFAHIGSGCDSFTVLGYRNAGYLASSNPEQISAVVVATCGDETRTTTVALGREWNGTGYMSEPLSVYSFLPRNPSCDYSNTTLSVAFSAGDQWDSRYGQNYGHFRFGMYDDLRPIAVHQTHTIGAGVVNLAAWRFIVEQMRQ